NPGVRAMFLSAWRRSRTRVSISSVRRAWRKLVDECRPARRQSRMGSFPARWSPAAAPNTATRAVRSRVRSLLALGLVSLGRDLELRIVGLIELLELLHPFLPGVLRREAP